jgi:pimeloyl-ACP methyl ester carboxylesterase
MTVDDYAGVVRAELTRRGLAHVCLVGHSLGSAIALRMAVEYPALVSRLVLVGAGARMRVLPALLEEARSDPPAAKATLVEMAFTPAHLEQARSYIQQLAPTAPGMLYRDLAACDGFDIMGELGHIDQPTLIVTGEEDRLTPPKYARFLAEHLESAHLALLPNAGHYAQLEAPDAVAGAIRAWLE